MEEVQVTLVSLIISTAVTLLLNITKNKQSSSEHYSDIISKDRIEWINKTRKTAAEFLGFCEANNELNSENKMTYYKLKNELLLNLNTDKRKYKTDAVIRSILIDNSFKTVKNNLPALRDAFNTIFKSEWDKVKLETGRSKRKVQQLERRDASLKKYYKTKR